MVFSGSEFLDAAVRGVGDIDITVVIDCNTQGIFELTRVSPISAPSRNERHVLIKLLNSVIRGISDKDMSCANDPPRGKPRGILTTEIEKS